MTSQTFLGLLLLISLMSTTVPPLGAADAKSSEKDRIEALLTQVADLKDATFVRNGSEHDAKTAAKFLRGKWQSHEKEIASAEDFIDKVATRSSTTGKPYLIRMKGAADVPCADYLRAQLKKLAPAR